VLADCHFTAIDAIHALVPSGALRVARAQRIVDLPPSAFAPWPAVRALLSKADTGRSPVLKDRSEPVTNIRSEPVP